MFGLILGVISAIFNFIAGALGDTTTISDGNSIAFTSNYTAGSIIVSIIGSIVTLVVAGYVASSYWNGILQIADGQQVSIGSFFQPRNVVGT